MLHGGEELNRIESNLLSYMALFVSRMKRPKAGAPSFTPKQSRSAETTAWPQNMHALIHRG